jgi:hypothetical protein
MKRSMVETGSTWTTRNHHRQGTSENIFVSIVNHGEGNQTTIYPYPTKNGFVSVGEDVIQGKQKYEF